jgi:hypothetical protein
MTGSGKSIEIHAKLFEKCFDNSSFTAYSPGFLTKKRKNAGNSAKKLIKNYSAK